MNRARTRRCSDGKPLADILLHDSRRKSRRRVTVQVCLLSEHSVQHQQGASDRSSASKRYEYTREDWYKHRIPILRGIYRKASLCTHESDTWPRRVAALQFVQATWAAICVTSIESAHSLMRSDGKQLTGSSSSDHPTCSDQATSDTPSVLSQPHPAPQRLLLVACEAGRCR